LIQKKTGSRRPFPEPKAYFPARPLVTAGMLRNLAIAWVSVLDLDSFSRLRGRTPGGTHLCHQREN